MAWTPCSNHDRAQGARASSLPGRRVRPSGVVGACSTFLVLVATLVLTTAASASAQEASSPPPPIRVVIKEFEPLVTASADYLSKLSLDLVPVPTIKDAYRLLDDDKVDAVVFDSPVLLYHAASAGKGSVEVVGPVFARQDYGIALPNGSPLRKEINATILSIIEDGRYAELQARWFGPPETN